MFLIQEIIIMVKMSCNMKYAQTEKVLNLFRYS